MGNHFHLYQKIGGTFSFHFSDSCLSGYPRSIALSHDCQWIVFGCSSSKEVKIYHNVPPFTLVQTFILASTILDLAISGSNLLITLFITPRIMRHYKYNGSQFEFDFEESNAK